MTVHDDTIKELEQSAIILAVKLAVALDFSNTAPDLSGEETWQEILERAVVVATQLRSRGTQLQKQFESAQDRFTISWGLRVFQGLKQHKGDLDAAQHITMAARDVLEEAERER